MPDNRYCYKDSDVLINKLNIRNKEELFYAEKELTFIRLQELQDHPIKGSFDFKHLKKIHQYIFQDIYEWAGKVRTVEIGKGNLFCTTACIDSYAESVFDNFYRQCFASKEDFHEYIKVFARNYADLNALHPFREGNGRTQREFARLVCQKCGYYFDLSCTTHNEMLEASRLSFDRGDCSLLEAIFAKAVSSSNTKQSDSLGILTKDDLVIEFDGKDHYEYYEDREITNIEDYNKLYQVRTQEIKE